MSSRRVSVFCGLLYLVISVHASDTAGQVVGYPEISTLAASFDQQWLAAGSTGQKDLWSAPSFHVAWMTVPNRIHVGYDGLVPPGACVSSFFVYPLRGVNVGGSVPVSLTDQHALRVYGSYLIADNSQAAQEITWTNNPPGIREWRRSNSQWYKIGGEALYRISGQTALLGGFRFDSLLSNFSDPNPSYLFTIPQMEAQTMVTVYEPYLGIRLQQSSGPGVMNLQVIGFPFLFATIQHLNVCNNNGVPFAHTGNQNATTGFFVEVSAEYRLLPFQGVELAAFIDWNIYQGRCSMNIDRHERGPNPGVTSAEVVWSHYINSLVLGGKVAIAWNLPF